MQEKSFLFTTIIQYHEEKVLPVLRQLDDLLNQHLSLSKYSDSVQYIAYAFVVISEEETADEQYIEYNDEDDFLFLQLLLPYEILTHTATADLTFLFARTYLESLTLYDTIDLPDFDIAHFRMDLQELFEEEEWLVGEVM